MSWFTIAGHDCPTLRQFNNPHQPPDSPFYVKRPDDEMGFARCPQCGTWMPLDGTETPVPESKVGCDSGKWAATIPEPGPPLVVGCWVETERWGEAVVTAIEPTFIAIRYRANRCIHDENGIVVGYEEESIWAVNGENPWECRFLRPPDGVSEHVLTLRGPYGEG